MTLLSTSEIMSWMTSGRQEWRLWRVRLGYVGRVWGMG